MSLMVSISGIRGIVGESLTPEVAVRYARAFAEYSRRGGATHPTIVLGRDGRISGDTLSSLLTAAQQNARTAGVEHLIEFQACDFRQTAVPDGEGDMILNPEYGERMGNVGALEEIYKEIGDFFKARCMGYRGYIFRGNLDLAKKVGLRTKRRIPFYNGPIECRLLEYELYRGSRKDSSGA